MEYNYGYLLLGLIIEKISGMSYAQYLKENLFDVAGMRDTQVVGAKDFANDKIANGYMTYNPKSGFISTDSYYQSSGIDIDQRSFVEIYFSSGNILSTAEDLNKWYQALFCGQIISKDLLEKAHTPYLENGDNQPAGYPFIPYGYGWVVDNSKGANQKTISHAGQVPGSTSNVIFQPSSKTLIILLSNYFHQNLPNESYNAINFLSSLMFNYATEVIDQPLKKSLLPDSKIRSHSLDSYDIQSVVNEDFMQLNDDSGFISMSELLKKLNI